MEEELLEQVKGLFQESYKVIYKDGAFDTMMTQAEADGDYKPAVAQLTATVINSTIADAGVTNLEVLFGLAILIISDLLESLEKIGTTTEEGDVEDIINKTMQLVLGKHPALAKKMSENPNMQQMAETIGGPEARLAVEASDGVPNQAGPTGNVEAAKDVLGGEQ